MIKLAIILGFMFIEIYSKCGYKVKEDGKPEKVGFEPYLVQDLTQCL